MTFFDRLKHKIWLRIYPFFPFLHKNFPRLCIVFHGKKRQKYHIGWLVEGRTLEELKKHLHEKWGFGNHFVAWVDLGQVLSWRKLESFNQQYHLRVFEDGEIRGHHEYTPEAHPWDHFFEKNEEDRKSDFFKFLGDFTLEEKIISHLVMDPEAHNLESQITIDHIKN